MLANGTWGDHAKGEATISGGTFIVDESAEGATLIWYGQGSGTGGTLEVSNAVFEGTFNEKVTDIYDVDITSCSSTSQVPSNLVADGMGEIGLDGIYHVGTTNSLLSQVANTEKVSTIDVVVGSFELNNVSGGVKVTNSGAGKVSANGVNVAPGNTVTVESGLPFTIVTGTPKDCIVTEGETATFTVEVDFGVNEDKQLGYQWRKSTDGGKTFKVIEGANEASYTTSKTTLANNGYQYECIVFDPGSLMRTRSSLTDADIEAMDGAYLRSRAATLNVKEAGAEPEPGEPVVPPTGDSPLLYAAIGAAVLCLLGLCLPALRKNRG